MMVAPARCEICEVKPPIAKCRVCGRDVCELDYDRESNVCSACRDSLCRICNRYLSISVCRHCGRHACEDCLVEISPVEYICIECYRRLKVDG